MYGSFSRTIALPNGFDQKSVHAQYKDGILEVSLGIPVSVSVGKKIRLTEQSNEFLLILGLERIIGCCHYQGECCVWSDGLAPNAAPREFTQRFSQVRSSFTNVREGQSHRGHDVDMFGKEYLESISLVLAGAHEILLITHGTGKSNAFAAFKEHIDSHHSDLARRIIGHLEADLTNLTRSSAPGAGSRLVPGTFFTNSLTKPPYRGISAGLDRWRGWAIPFDLAEKTYGQADSG